MNIALVGSALLTASIVASIWSVGTSALGAKRRDGRLIASGRRALYATGALIATACAALLAAIFQHDFSLNYVAAYTSRSTPGIYRFTALWAGMEGSLLFWTLLTCGYAVSAIAVQTARKAAVTPVATIFLSLTLVFFTGLLRIGANPFELAPSVPADGAGLNPLLQSPFMAIHPVLLYLGLTGFAVPFSFAMASLVTGRLDAGWFTSTRRWTMLAWSFLTSGIVLGAAWAYMELGWGGYWAWDPVENASLLPWLTGTAFLHSVMIQERRGMLKIWNVGLILGTYSLAIFGTFLTRSGLVTSVHTFSESPVGKMFLPFLALILIGAFGLLGWRFEKLRSRRHLDSMLSREAMFLFNNLFFVAIAFTVLWGTLYPVLVEAVSGRKISVGPPFFNTVVAPLGLALLGLTGIGPLIAWRRSSAANVRRQFAVPLVAGAACIVGMTLAGVDSVGARLALGLCVFVAVGTITEFIKAGIAHRGPGRGFLRALMGAVGHNRRRYGGYIVHLGVVLIFLGLAGASFRQTWSGSLEQGGSFDLGRYSVRYDSSRVFATREKMVNMAVMKVFKNDREVATLTPQRNFHLAQRQPQSEVGLRTSLSDDLYLVLTEMDSSRRVQLRAWVNPLVIWIWIGGAVMSLGSVFIMTSKRARPSMTAPLPDRTRDQQVPVGAAR